MPTDPRWPQIAVLSTLLFYGVVALDFEVQWGQTLLTIGACQLTQWLGSRWARIPFDPRSALISSLSLCLLLRVDHMAWAVVAGAITIGSKFLLRWHGKHLWNPTCFGLVAMMLITDQAWVSPGQWGSLAIQGFAMACLASLVLRRSPKSDVTIAFLVFYGALLFGRSWWLSEPVAIPLHRIENGAFLLFAFFMVSDPKTIPDARPARILFALLVALGAAYVHFVRFDNNGFLWSLAALAITVPLLDRVFPAARYQWPAAPNTLEVRHAA